MKKHLISWVNALCLVFVFNIGFAQNLSLEGILDKAVSLTQSGGNQSELASLLSMGATTLNKEASTVSNNKNLVGKLLGQVGNLNSLASLASSSGLKLGDLTKVINTVKLLLAANRISNIIGGGKSNILSNAAGLTSNLGLLKAGASVLGGNSSNLIGGLIKGATSSIGKFGNKGFLGIGSGKAAAGKANNQFGKIINLVSSSL